ncbi:MAG: PIN domain-containing protein [Christensenellaceae bacterium]|jgi:predicted nucleic acid-binding protein|nr:PIN domain-containing protein [Christensenellaceae bacterium]
MKVLIDTNVILDALMNRDPWAAAAQELLRYAAMEKVKGFVAASQTTDIFYLLRRAGAEEGSAKEIIKKLTDGVGVSDITPADVQGALASNMPDYEDALLAFCAKRQKAEYIITRNEKDFGRSQVPAISPSAFLEKLSST